MDLQLLVVILFSLTRHQIDSLTPAAGESASLSQLKPLKPLCLIEDRELGDLVPRSRDERTYSSHSLSEIVRAVLSKYSKSTPITL